MTKLDALIDTRGLMDELGVKRHAAEQIIRQLPKVQIPGVRRLYVKRKDVERLIEEQTAA